MIEVQGRAASESPGQFLRGLPVADLLVVGAVQLAVCWLVRANGFSAISDDDYARVVIAQRFAEAPALDPSGTSWLPFPFWLYGLVMELTSPSLAVAYRVATATAALSSALIYASGRVLGAPRVFSVLGAVAVALIPYSAALAAATVPEYLNAALLTFALSTLAVQERPRLALTGALALFVSCASRYEGWPAAAVFALIHLFGARAPGARWRIAAAGMASAFPLLWLLHGQLNHNNALFFVKRVVDYKEALGGETAHGLTLALAYPKALVLAEPEVTFIAFGVASALAFGWFRSDGGRRWSSVWLPASALLLGLIIGAVRGGAPTHHAERALLSLWMLATVSIVAALGHNLAKWKTALTLVFVYGALGVAARHGGAFEREPFSSRTAELKLGRQLASMADEPVGLALPDYGYFAVMAQAGNPSRFTVLKKHDPRDPAPAADPISTWVNQGGCYYVTTTDTPRGDDQLVGRPVPPLEVRRAGSCVRSSRPKN